VLRKCSLLGLEFLKANDIRLSFFEPSQEIFRPLVDVVDIESGDLHYSGLKPQRHCGLSECAGGWAKQWDQFIICRRELFGRNWGGEWDKAEGA
jgi:hypothetical protein